MLSIEQLQQADELAAAYRTLRSMGNSFGDSEDPNGLIFDIARESLFETLNLAAYNTLGKSESKAMAVAAVERILGRA